MVWRNANIPDCKDFDIRILHALLVLYFDDVDDKPTLFSS
ncbi:hypothetical protein METHB2_710020 [Candidatus Methylobacter favarea]|uniref:Uncharacterized protein n=1 Tax=Candidatus Methylobacter favarea TaxID=2707345 RepID=A0A8S0X9Q0_9GAMM|nr:hypothetical protein METHB2_710020 [Candidatus Methylobacter favarea]